MPKTKFEDAIFTAIMATLMVYGMIVYNIALSKGDLTNEAFLLALNELKIMMPVAFALEFFAVGKIAPKLAFKVVRPTDRPQVITYAISVCICCIMCPVMSFIAMLLFKEPSFAVWVKTAAMNMPCALIWQLLFCGPLVRLIFRSIFRRENVKTKEYSDTLERNRCQAGGNIEAEDSLKTA